MLEDDLGVLDTEGEFEDADLPGARWSFAVEETGTAGLVLVTVTVHWGGDWGERQVSLSRLRPEFDALPTAQVEDLAHRREAAVTGGGR